MTPEPRMADEVLAQHYINALAYVARRTYKSLAELVKSDSKLAKVHGQEIVGTMYQSMLDDGKPLSHGHHLNGEQLQVLAYIKKAGADIGCGDITAHLLAGEIPIHFDYVARIERDGRGYVVQFPDLQGCVTQGPTIKAVEKNTQEALNGYISSLILHGDTLPVPKYHGRKTKKVRPFKVQLTLADLVFEDTKKEVRDFTASIERDAGFSKP